jgi:hypothetical protein
MYNSDPAAVVRHCATLVRRGGVVVFQEFDFAGARTWPEAPLFQQCLDWMQAVFARTGADCRLGPKLRRIYIEAGLPAPRLRLDAAIGGGPGHDVYSAIADVVRSLLPALEKLGIAKPAEVQIDTLRYRLEAAIVESNGIVTSPSLIGAWAQVT